VITYPEINPIALELGPIRIYWYGLMYLLSFVSAWLLIRYRVIKNKGPFSLDAISDLMLFYAPIGVIAGGRLGYVFFYHIDYFLADPLYVFKMWEGGMSFHGGLLGVIAAMLWFARREKVSPWVVADLIAPAVPVGLGLGRIGNFINGELWGRVTEVPWAMVFPAGGPLARHPTQLYEAFLEGFAMWLLLWLYSAKPQPERAVSGMFLLLYGLFRFGVEFFREPDPHLGFIFSNTLTMGQVLSIPMFLLGVFILVRSYYANVP
jgi:phosphatidylglycerol---prolipoprotein diacylglyceryl transferase